MIKEKIKIAGKTVIVGYCYATEIAYKELSGEDISKFIGEALTSINMEPRQMPDVKKTVFLILAGIMSFYNAEGQDAPINDTHIMNEATPVELGTAIGTMLNLWAQFYKTPEGETKPKKGKSAKN